MQKLPLYLLAAVTVGVSGFAFYQHGQIQDQTSRIAALEQSISAQDKLRSDAQAAAEKLQQQNTAFIEESTTLRQKLAVTPAPEPVATEAPATPAAAPEKKNGFAGMMDKMMKDPKMVDAIAAQQMAVIKPMYADLVKQLKLTPQETEEFYKLLTAQTSKAMEAGMKMMSGDKKAMEDMKNGQDEMKTFLGARYSQYEEYQKSIPDRGMLTQISSQMAARQMPLRPDQSNGLLQIMQQEKLNTAKFTKANTDPNNTSFDDQMISDTMQAQEERNTRILARSKTLLSADQWNAFAEQQKQTLQMQKMGMDMARSMMGEGKK